MAKDPSGEKAGDQPADERRAEKRQNEKPHQHQAGAIHAVGLPDYKDQVRSHSAEASSLLRGKRSSPPPAAAIATHKELMVVPDYKDQVRASAPGTSKLVSSVKGVPVNEFVETKQVRQTAAAAQAPERSPPRINAKNRQDPQPGAPLPSPPVHPPPPTELVITPNAGAVCLTAQVVDEEAERRREEEYQQMLSTVRHLREQIDGGGGGGDEEEDTTTLPVESSSKEGARQQRKSRRLKILIVVTLLLVIGVVVAVVVTLQVTGGKDAAATNNGIVDGPTQDLDKGSPDAPNPTNAPSTTNTDNENPTQAATDAPSTNAPTPLPLPSAFSCLVSVEQPCTWEPVGIPLRQPSGDSTSYWGTSVALSGNGIKLAIGVPGDGTFDAVPGYVRVYTLDPETGNWAFTVDDDIAGEASNDRFGSSVALSDDGTTLVVGAFGNDGAQGTSSSAGHVRISRGSTTDGGWTQLGSDIDGEAQGDESGRSVSLSADGTVVAIGTRNAYPRVFVYNTNEDWSTVGDLALYEYDSSSVSLSSNGNILAVGNYRDSTGGFGSGSARVFRYRSTTDWSQVGGTIVGENSEDEAGRVVALSSDGMILAVGSPASGEVAARPGSVRVFQYVDNDWIQLGPTIQGSTNGDEFGWDIKLSETGTIVAIGARNANDAGESSGRVAVFHFDGESWGQVGNSVNGEDSFHIFGAALSLTRDGTTFAAGSSIGDYVSVYQVE